MNPKCIVQLGEEAADAVKNLQHKYPLSARRATDVLARAFNRLGPAEQLECLRKVPEAVPKRPRRIKSPSA